MVLGRCWSLESRKLLEIFKGSWPSRFFNDNVAFVDKFCWIFGFKKELQFPPWKCRLPDRYSSRHSCGFVLFCFFSPWRTRVAPHCRLTKGYFFYDFQFVWCWTQTRRQTGLMTIFNAISKCLKR